MFGQKKEAMAELKSDDQLEQVYQQTETIPVLGDHPNPNKPLHLVPDYLQKQGYKVTLVNSKNPDQELWEAPRATLGKADMAVDCDAGPVHVRRAQAAI